MNDERPFEEAQPVWEKPPTDDAPVAPLDSAEQAELVPAEETLVAEPVDEYASVPVVVEVVEALTDAPEQSQQSVWLRVRRMLGLGRPDTAELEMRLADLNRAIAEHPDAALNYVLRGELYLEARDDQRASVNFEQALALAVQEAANADWGIIAQVAQDRALEGLRFVGVSTGL